MPAEPAGEAVAVHDAKAIHLRWFDHWLKGKGNGLLGDPRVKVFFMGRNEWRETSS